MLTSLKQRSNEKVAWPNRIELIEPTPLRALSYELQSAVDQQIPGRVRDLALRLDADNRYVLSGIVNSYYAKQMTQQIAMRLLTAGVQVVNDIEVRSVR